ncbi:MAG: methionine--tRNA ligase [bacterium]|nr:methionine--tRNA ligase [bacterium]
MKRKILVTSALPYANGDIHLGHMVEVIQTDIWVRFQKIMGNTCYYVCADDTHGTPVMMTARKLGIPPEQLIKEVHKSHIKDFQGFYIEFDNYYSTESEENKELSEYIYNMAAKEKAIYEKEIDQLFCINCKMFLPDRFIKGICPVCKADDQYGDSCEHCSSTYNAADMIDPFCVECSNKPEIRKSNHYFFKLSAFKERVEDWINQEHVKPEIRNKLREWFDQGIRDWDISRDAPYFGFKIPGTADKYFYVWMDAPVGYIAATRNLCEKKGYNFDDIWRNGKFEIYHFIGKDILYFHTLFWPAMLMVSGFNLPAKVNVHGFLTVNGTKMSKSRGTFINASKYLEYLNPEFLRYYYASKLTSSIDDIDFSIEDFVYKVNADIVNKVVNIGSRLGSIVYKKLDAKITEPDYDGKKLIQKLRASRQNIQELYENLEYSKAMKEIIALAAEANKYIDEKAPWKVIKEDAVQASMICTTGLNALRIIICYLKPVLPVLAEGVESFLNIKPLTWEDISVDLNNHTINKYQHLANRIDIEQARNILS